MASNNYFNFGGEIPDPEDINEELAEDQMEVTLNSEEPITQMSIPMSLDQMIIKSLSSVSDIETRKKLSKNITLVGGGCSTGAA